MRRRHRAAVLALAASALSAASGARANGRFPAAGQIAVDPADPSHLVVRATYGILSTTNAGARWEWICEGAVGFGGFEDPPLALTSGGAMIAGTYEGVAVSHDGGCGWAFAGGDLAGAFVVVDDSTERADPKRAVAITTVGLGGGVYTTKVYETLDDGAARAGLRARATPAHRSSPPAPSRSLPRSAAVRGGHRRR